MNRNIHVGKADPSRIRAALPVLRLGPMARGAYHHGDLGNAALAEVLVVLAEKGAHGVTFAEVARRLGVSAPALYRHYADPPALLAAAAIESFGLFEEALRAARGAKPPERLRGMLNAYLGFALDHPARYELMFATTFGDRPAALDAAGVSAFVALVDTLAACCPNTPRPALIALARQVWALCHGFASLGVQQMHLSKREAQSLLASAVEQVVDARRDK